MPDTAALAGGRQVLTVGELTAQIKQTLEGTLGALWLVAEVSNLRTPASGHIYLTLKDADSQVRGVVWGATARYLKHRPRDGDQVLCRGRITVYAPRGDYQFIIDYLEPAGTGTLLRDIEIRSAELAAEGLFADDRKRPLPALPRRVGVVTSADGAAVRDVLTVLARRAPGMAVLVAATPVQGPDAPAGIVRALEGIARADGIDVVLVVRGGGALEDLMAFNTTEVARAIAACPVPVVCGVGHETDTTIADRVADVRAATPSAAAELVSATWMTQAAQLAEWQRRLARATGEHLARFRLRWQRAQAGLMDPRERVRHLLQRVDVAGERLAHGARFRFAEHRRPLERAVLRLMAAAPTRQTAALAQRVTELDTRLKNTVLHQLHGSRAQVEGAAAQLGQLSPLAVLSRGYAVARQDGRALTRADQTAVGESLAILLGEGELTCRVEAVRKTRRMDPIDRTTTDPA